MTPKLEEMLVINLLERILEGERILPVTHKLEEVKEKDAPKDKP